MEVGLAGLVCEDTPANTSAWECYGVGYNRNLHFYRQFSEGQS